MKTCSCCGRVYKQESDFLEFGDRWRICNQGHLWFNCDCNSTLIVKKGKFDWYDPAAGMRDTAKSVFNKLAGQKEIPRLPTEIMQLQQALDDDSTSSKDLAAICKTNPLILSEIIRTANTMKESSGNKVTDISHAISYLGRQNLKELAFVAAARTVSFQTKVYREDDFWLEAFATGQIAERLTRKLGINAMPEEAFLMGTMVNFGKAVAAILFPQEVDKMATQMKDPRQSKNWKLLESENSFHKHVVLGEITASLWGLPKSVIEICGDHHNLNKVLLTDEALNLSDIVAVAIQLTHWVNLNSLQVDAFVIKRFAKKAGLSEENIQKIVEEELLSVRDDIERQLISN